MDENKNTKNTKTGEGSSAPTQSAKANNFTGENQKSDSRANDTSSPRNIDSSDQDNSDKSIYNKAKETSEQVLTEVKAQAASTVEEQKGVIASSLGQVADSIRKVGSNLRQGDEQNAISGITAKYGDNLAQKLEKLSNYIDRRELKQMMRDVEGFARRNPAIFVGAAFAVGFLAVRFLKSSVPNQRTEKKAQNRLGKVEAPAY